LGPDRAEPLPRLSNLSTRQWLDPSAAEDAVPDVFVNLILQKGNPS
jgi:hypothetical protein